MITFTSASPNSGLSIKLTSHFYTKKDYLTIVIKFLWFQYLFQILFTRNNRRFYFPTNYLVKSNVCERTLVIIFVEYVWFICFLLFLQVILSCNHGLRHSQMDPRYLTDPRTHGQWSRSTVQRGKYTLNL
jgi:hypothetical protein